MCINVGLGKGGGAGNKVQYRIFYGLVEIRGTAKGRLFGLEDWRAGVGQ